MLAMLSGTLLTLRARHGPPHLFLASPAASPCRPDRMNFALLANKTGIGAHRFQPLASYDGYVNVRNEVENWPSAKGTNEWNGEVRR